MNTSFNVPIRNLFCMLSYVHEMPELIHSLSDIEEDVITYDFIANEFIQEAEFLILQGQTNENVSYGEQMNRLAVRFGSNEATTSVCEKDEDVPNLLLQQLTKATLTSISTIRSVKKRTRKRSFQLAEQMPNVARVKLTKDIFHRIRSSRQTSAYQRMFQLARMLHELRLLSHKRGNCSLFSVTIDDTALNRLFEEFLFHFYRVEQGTYRVSSEVMKWELDGNTTVVPTMKTGIALTHTYRQEKIVIDIKFYKQLLQEFHGKSSFQSNNMYQLFTYLMHQPQEHTIRGILLYPFNGKEVQESYRWSDRVTMEMVTINLNDSWKTIRNKLVRLL